MEHIYALLRSVAIFFLLVLFIQVLKRQGIFNTSHQPVFNRLITELALPVTIFSTLAVSRIHPDQILSAGIMLAAVTACCLIAYGACRVLQLSNRVTGSLVMLAGFGSTSTLAYPLISQTFGTGSDAMTLGLIVGEFGVCIPFFTAGVLIAAYFGSRDDTKKTEAGPVIRAFFVSPIFIAFLCGLVVSQIAPVSALFSTDFCTTFFGYFDNGLEMLVAVSIGLMLKPIRIREILPAFALVVLLKLVLQPVLVVWGAGLTGMSPLATEILLIEAAMPSGAIAAVIADRYGCDGPLASTLVVATYVISLVTIPLMTLLI